MLQVLLGPSEMLPTCCHWSSSGNFALLSGLPLFWSPCGTDTCECWDIMCSSQSKPATFLKGIRDIECCLQLPELQLQFRWEIEASHIPAHILTCNTGCNQFSLLWLWVLLVWFVGLVLNSLHFPAPYLHREPPHLISKPISSAQEKNLIIILKVLSLCNQPR